MGYITGRDRTQQVLFPEALDEYVRAENPVRCRDAFVAALDLAAQRPDASERPLTIATCDAHPAVVQINADEQFSHRLAPR